MAIAWGPMSSSLQTDDASQQALPNSLTKESSPLGKERANRMREAAPSISDVATLSDIDLVTRTLKGEKEAFSEIVRRYQDAVFNLCLRMLNDYHEAEDAAQEIFVKVYRHLNRFDKRRRFSTWILSIARNHCIDRLRTRRVTWVSLDAPEVYKQGEYIRPEEHVIEQERSDNVQRLLQKLPVSYREVIVLHYWYDLSYQEIAEIVNASEGAVKARAHRARRELGKLLQKNEEDL